MKSKICGICNNKFLPKSRQQLYCENCHNTEKLKGGEVIMAKTKEPVTPVVETNIKTRVDIVKDLLKQNKTEKEISEVISDKFGKKYSLQQVKNTIKYINENKK